MSSYLDKNVVLVLNRSWQAIATITPVDAFCHMSADTAHGLDIQSHDHMQPTPWEEWLKLPVRDCDNATGTVRGAVRIPTVLVLTNYAKVPMYRPKFGIRSIWLRDEGRCQYTGRILKPHEGNIDHILPKSRGGATTWTNCVLAWKKVNSRKSNRTPEEAGLRLLRRPAVPRALPVTQLLRNLYDIPDWHPFLT